MTSCRDCLFFMLLLCLMAGCAGARDGDEITSLEQLNSPERKIGVASDTAEDQLVARELPNAQIKYVKDSIRLCRCQPGKAGCLCL